MVKILEVKETLEDSKLIDNIYLINGIIKDIIKQTEFITELNKDDFNYLNIVLEKTKTNLRKVQLLTKLK